jgi:threonine aldolase
MEFSSDNVFGVHDSILAALSEANAGTARSYSYDEWTAKAQAALNDVFETKVESFLVATGTAANSLGLSSLCAPHQTVLCHVEAHIQTDECGAPEFFTGGAKLTGLSGIGCKLTPTAIRTAIENVVRGEHEQPPGAVSITQATELGTIYSAGETAAIGAAAQELGLNLHLDGSRFANAVAASGATPADLTWKAGVKAMSFGATKNGALALEAVLFFDAHLARDFLFRRKRGGQLLSKGRYLGAQMVAYLKDDLWLRNARHANGLATRLAEELNGVASIRLPVPVQANEVFAILPRSLFAHLTENGVGCHEWLSQSLGPEGPKENECLVRFVTSFRTSAEDVRKLAEICEGMESKRKRAPRAPSPTVSSSS